MRHSDKALDTLWEEEEWREIFKDIDNFVSDIKNDKVAMEFIDELDQTLYCDDSLGKQKEMRFTNFESENFGTEKNIHQEDYLIGDKFEESELDQRCLRLMSSGTVITVTEAEQGVTPLVMMVTPPSPESDKCPGKVNNKLVKSFACTWPHCDKRYKKSSHLKVTTKEQPVATLVDIYKQYMSNCINKINILPFSGAQAGAHGGAALHVPPPLLRPHLCPVSDIKYSTKLISEDCQIQI